MDAIDSKVLSCLAQNGRISWADLAHQLGMSAPAAADRVRKLEEAGIVRGYAAIIPPQAMGLQLTAFVGVTFGKSKHRKPFLKAIQRIPEILECHHVAGDEDFLLKVLTRDTGHLDHLVSEQLRAIPGVLRTRTTVVLSTQKEGHYRPTQPHVEAAIDDRKASFG